MYNSKCHSHFKIFTSNLDTTRYKVKSVRLSFTEFYTNHVYMRTVRSECDFYSSTKKYENFRYAIVYNSKHKNSEYITVYVYHTCKNSEYIIVEYIYIVFVSLKCIIHIVNIWFCGSMTSYIPTSCSIYAWAWKCKVTARVAIECYKQFY